MIWHYHHQKVADERMFIRMTFSIRTSKIIRAAARRTDAVNSSIWCVTKQPLSFTPVVVAALHQLTYNRRIFHVL
jgi:hypothetical protein